MKQRVVVQVIFRQGDEVILLKRSQGRPNLVGRYELPGGTINNGEQPDDALRRHILSAMGITIDYGGLSLSDVMSLNSREEGDIQHVFVVYEYNKPIDKSQIKLGSSYSSYVDLNIITSSNVGGLRESAQLILGLHGDRDTKMVNGVGDVKTTTKHSATTIYSDGGSRGNPGPSASAFVIVDSDHNVVGQGGEYIGITTNNQAEYQGVLLGLEKASELKLNDIEFRIDSMLVVNQLKGLYKIKNRELWPINERIKELLPSFSKVGFTHVPREMNKRADSLVNKLLDEHKDF